MAEIDFANYPIFESEPKTMWPDDFNRFYVMKFVSDHFSGVIAYPSLSCRASFSLRAERESARE